jgi:preprotein translocase subunit Sss1
MVYMQQKVNQQVNRPAGRKVNPARLAAVAEAKRIPRVRVEPTTEEYRRVLKHGSTKIGFRAEGSAEWPNDRFTQRRLAEGVIRIVESAEGRQERHARKPSPSPQK